LESLESKVILALEPLTLKRSYGQSHHFRISGFLGGWQHLFDEIDSFESFDVSVHPPWQPKALAANAVQTFSHLHKAVHGEISEISSLTLLCNLCIGYIKIKILSFVVLLSPTDF